MDDGRVQEDAIKVGENAGERDHQRRIKAHECANPALPQRTIPRLLNYVRLRPYRPARSARKL
jgi:hypothetical protein